MACLNIWVKASRAARRCGEERSRDPAGFTPARVRSAQAATLVPLRELREADPAQRLAASGLSPFAIAIIVSFESSLSRLLTTQ